MKLSNIFTNKVYRVLYIMHQIFFRYILIISQHSQVIHQSIQPNIYRLFRIIWHSDSPTYSFLRPRNRKLWTNIIKKLIDLMNYVFWPYTSTLCPLLDFFNNLTLEFKQIIVFFNQFNSFAKFGVICLWFIIPNEVLLHNKCLFIHRIISGMLTTRWYIVSWL